MISERKVSAKYEQKFKNETGGVLSVWRGQGRLHTRASTFACTQNANAETTNVKSITLNLQRLRISAAAACLLVAATVAFSPPCRSLSGISTAIFVSLQSDLDKAIRGE